MNDRLEKIRAMASGPTKDEQEATRQAKEDLDHWLDKIEEAMKRSERRVSMSTDVGFGQQPMIWQTKGRNWLYAYERELRKLLGEKFRVETSLHYDDEEGPGEWIDIDISWGK